jgi:hypothetical protein
MPKRAICSWAPGVYDCNTDGRLNLELRLTGPNTCSASGGTGKVHIEPSGKIVFETGPLSKFSSKLQPGGRIGLNQDGGSFCGASCELNRNKH